MNPQLIEFGFHRSFIETLDYELLEKHEIGRITGVFKDRYTITDGSHEIPAELVGKLLYNATSPIDFPTVGDWVLADFLDKRSHALIHEILPRRSLLKRKASGKKIDFQLIGANIDVAFIMQSLNENFNPRRLERYLVMCNESRVTPLVLLSKADLVSQKEIDNKTHEVQQLQKGIKVIAVSCEDETNLQAVEQELEPGSSYCLLGSSGVGKTTLLNHLIGESHFATQTISKRAGKGRHTTTHRQLVKLPNGALFIDTPGMRELGNFSVETGIDETFSEIYSLTEKCFFSDCTHTSEKGCAVREALEQGEISEERFQNFLKMGRESRFNEMSYLEKRNKDREFGKMCKNIMKHKKNRR